MTILAARSNVAHHRLGDALLGQLSALAAASSEAKSTLGHLTSVAVDTLHTLANPTTNVPASLADHLYERQLALGQRREQSEALAANSTAESLARQLALLVDELTEALSADLPNTVNSSFGPVRLADYLRANCILLVGLAYRVIGAATQAALAESVRALASVLAERQPGQSIELRVPPLAAVQLGAIGDASVHTRGTPPNVVEMNPRVFMMLATGSTAWDDAYAAGELNVSGAHASDVAEMLPVLDLLG